MSSQLPPVQNLGFGIHFCPFYIKAIYKNEKWGPLELCDYKDLSLNPAAKVLHYGQEIFEGLKAYKQSDGSVALFRPQDAVKRMTRSAEIMVMPPFPEAEFLDGLKTITKKCQEWVPAEPGTLYLRPTMIGSSATLGVAAASEFIFYILASPSGTYFGSANAKEPGCIDVWISDIHVRAVRGGLGAAKTGANYAASLSAVAAAKKSGFANVLFLDALERKNLEELSGMNVFVVEDGILKTPTLGDTILCGITRDSIIKLARKLGIPFAEEVLPWPRLQEGLLEGRVSEFFASGTGASITAITELGYQNKRYPVGNKKSGPLTNQLYKALLECQFGRSEGAEANWLVKV